MKRFFTILGIICPLWAGTSALALVNPASQNCVDLGGTVQIYTDTASGQVGYCQLGQALVEEFSLYRGVVQNQHVLALDAYFSTLGSGFSSPGGVNPASSYCGGMGGESRLLTDAQGGQIGICRFSDKSEIEEFTLYRYTTDPRNIQFTNALYDHYPYAGTGTGAGTGAGAPGAAGTA